MIRSRAALSLALLVCLANAPALRAQEILAVVSSSPGPYQDAFEGFTAALGRKVEVVRLPRRPSAAGSRTRVVVAFGSEAAALPYPKDAIVISCLAPGLAEREANVGSLVHLVMRPAPEELLAALRRLQPGLRRLAVLSHVLARERYLADLKAAGAARGVDIIEVALKGPRSVPDALRALLPSKADALWLAPDPALVTAETFQTILQFSWDNRLPFYAPTRGLAAAGAPAAVAAGARETGRHAALLALRALKGEALPEVIYAENARLTVNLSSSRRFGPMIAIEAIRPDDEVIR